MKFFVIFFFLGMCISVFGPAFSLEQKGEYYLLSENSKLTWDSELELIPTFSPKEQGIWFEGEYKGKEFALWVSRVNGRNNGRDGDDDTVWKKIIAENKKNTEKKILNLGCKNLSQARLLCQRTEKEVKQSKEGKQITQNAHVQMVWNEKKDLIILRIMSFEDEALLDELNKKIHLTFNSKR